MKQYDCTYHGKKVGIVTVEKSGLYYMIRCRYNPENDQVYKLHVESETGKHKLGICVPVGERFGIDLKLPVSRIGNEIQSFTLHLKERSTLSGFEVSKTQSNILNILKMLPKARFYRHNAVAGIILTQVNPTKPGSDPNPESPDEFLPLESLDEVCQRQ